MKEPYSSILPMVYGSIAADMSYFFTASAQIPSAMILALEADKNGITASGGILIQTFPDTPESSIELVENEIKNMHKSLGRHLLDGADITSVAAELMGGNRIEITDETNIQLRCRCSKDMLAQTIAGFQREELLAMIDEDHGAEITCSFCKNVYRFNEDELRDILNAKNAEPIH
jgi:molecular chaperone Hsp33